MATSLFSTFLDHSSNAGFQAWYNELLTQFDAINPALLTRTADTGQIGATATRPAVNTSAGYAIWKFDDGQTPLYIKMEFGTASGAATAPRIWWTVGTGTNGTGTLTGSVNTRATLDHNATPGSTVTNYPSRICCIAGTFNLAWKEGANGTNICMAFGATLRTTTDAGVPDSIAFSMHNASGANNAIAGQCATIATNVTLSAANSTLFCLIPNRRVIRYPTSGTAQYYRHFAAIPFHAIRALICVGH